MRRAPRAGRFGNEFGVIANAEGLSTVGDQLAKVAVALPVYHRTGSAALSGLSFGLTFLPPLITGPTLINLSRHGFRSSGHAGWCGFRRPSRSDRCSTGPSTGEQGARLYCTR